MERAQELFKIETQIYYEGKETEEKRYNMTTLDVNASELLAIVPEHWSIENRLHRSLDMHFI